MQKTNTNGFILVCILVLFLNLKPEFIIPGLKSISAIRQIPNLLTLLIFTGWICHNGKILHNKETKYYIAFFLVLVIGTVFARNTGRAMYVTKGFTASVLAYLAIITYVNSLSKLKTLIRIFLFSNIIIAVLGIKGGGLVYGVPALTDENDFALLMNMLIPFSFFMAMSTEDLKNKIFLYSITGMFISGVIISFSRGGFVGLCCSLLFCFKHTKRKALIIVSTVLIAIGAMLFSPSGYWDEIATISEGTQESTASKRIYLWKNATIIFLHHPIIGVGPLNSGVWITTYDKSEQGQLDWGRALHSLFFTLISETGTIGTLLFFLILVYGERNRRQIRFLYAKKLTEITLNISDENNISSVKNHLRDSNYLSLALTGALIGYLSSGMFLSVLYYRWFWMILMYTVILHNLTQNLLSKYNMKPSEIHHTSF